MTQKERLVELLKTVPTTMGGVIDMDTVAKYADEIIDIEQIADHLLSSGVIVPPCKVGERLWVLDTDGRPREMVLDKPDIRCICAIEDNLCMATCDRPKTGICAYRLKNDGTDIGKTLFLSKAEAEQALKERET